MKDSQPRSEEDGIPFGQKLFDRPFLWLTVGFITMAIFYTLWGIYEIWILPKALLP